MQFVEVQDLGTTKAWNPQAFTVDTLRSLIHREVSGRPSSPDTRARIKYYIARPAFVKQRGLSFSYSRFKRKDLPWEEEYDKAPALPLFKREDDGSLAPTRQYAFNLGDFVDVQFGIDLVTKGDSVQTHLNLERVVLLKPARQVREILKVQAKQALDVSSAPLPSTSALTFPLAAAKVTAPVGQDKEVDDIVKGTLGEVLHAAGIVTPMAKLALQASANPKAKPANDQMDLN